jgi:endodeoxyribonuclease RusA
MSLTMSPNEQLEALVKQGVPRQKALVALGIPEASAQYVTDRTAHETVSLPFLVTLPWSALCSDNYHEKASLIRLANGEIAPRKLLDARYKKARDKTREIARHRVGPCLPVSQPLGITARVYVPNESLHDVCNFAKCLLDSLEGIVYDNDRWVYDTHWIRAGVNVDAPRAEVEVRAL